MGLPDKHDSRRFNHFAVLDADGNVISIVEIADGRGAPVATGDQRIVDVTDLHPYDFTDVNVSATVNREVKRGDKAIPIVEASPDALKNALREANKVSRV